MLNLKTIFLRLIISIIVALAFGFIGSYFFDVNYYLPLIFGGITSVLLLNFSKSKKQ